MIVEGATPIKAYCDPILRVLKRMGGRGKAGEVVEEVGRIMGAMLENEADQEIMERGNPRNRPRWMHRCHWARGVLKEQGKIRRGSPRGTWELS